MVEEKNSDRLVDKAVLKLFIDFVFYTFFAIFDPMLTKTSFKELTTARLSINSSLDSVLIFVVAILAFVSLC